MFGVGLFRSLLCQLPVWRLRMEGLARCNNDDDSRKRMKTTLNCIRAALVLLRRMVLASPDAQNYLDSAGVREDVFLAVLRCLQSPVVLKDRSACIIGIG